MFFPWGTDAPIYHWPWMTVVLIVTNVLVFIGVAGQPEESLAPWVLVYGQGLHPVQWLTSNFLHANVGHLIGNMTFLWAFALVVEGKLGALPFLGVYVGLGVVQCGLEQVAALGMDDGGALGSSAVIFGLMTMALVWAPRNDLNCVALISFFPSQMDIPILIFALLYISLEVVLVLLTRFAVTSALLHLSGAALGFVLASVMLKTNLVDCEGWDLFAVLQGRHGRAKVDAKPRRRSRPKRAPAARTNSELPDGVEDRAAIALRRLRFHVEAGEAEAAHGVYDKAVRSVRGWQPPGPDWLDLIKTLCDAKLWPASARVMEDYLRRAPDPSPRVRVKLAQVLIRELSRPAHGLRTLAGIPTGVLPEPLEKLRRQLTREAELMREEGVLELEGEAW